MQTSVEIAGDSPLERAQRFVTTYKNLYGLFMNDPFKPRAFDSNRPTLADRKSEVESRERRLRAFQGRPTSSPYLGLSPVSVQEGAVAFRETFKGIPVLGGNLVVFTKRDRVLGSAGTLVTDLDISVNPALSDKQAEELARAQSSEKDAPAMAKTGLVVLDPTMWGGKAAGKREPKLAWRVVLGNTAREVMYLDASNGGVVLSHSQIKSHGGFSDYDLDLEDANGENALDTDCYWDTTADDTLGVEEGLNTDGVGDPEAVKLFSVAKRTYAFYHNSFGIHSYDNSGGQYELYVHATPKGTVAMWLAGSVDCDLVDFRTGAITPDILAHELGHGVSEYVSVFGSPIYFGQSGALDESHSDTMGALADNNWLAGEGLSGGAIRDMSDPPAFGHPDRMDLLDTPNSDVHTNSGIPNKATFLLADGGKHPTTGWVVSGIGRPATGWLTFNVMLFMSPLATFSDARALTIGYANAFYGAQAACQARNSWAAVQVGNGDMDCDGIEENPDLDGDGTLNPLDNCLPIPNPSQKDTDLDGKGDVCDGDADEDGVLDPGYTGFPDNCPGVANSDQKDLDFDGIGTACDPEEDPNDLDGDGVDNKDDNCPLEANKNQEDVDTDDEGDVCDPDADGDGWSDNDDNAPFESNPDQKDSDGDGLGDVSDDCPEISDKVLVWTAGIPELGVPPQPIQPDSDGDGTPDACDPSLAIGGESVGSANDLKADGKSRTVQAQGTSGSYLRVPIEVGEPGKGANLSADQRRILVIDGLRGSTKTWIGDASGNTAARPDSRSGSRRSFTFRPISGREYFLFLGFGSEADASLQEEFTAQLSMHTAKLEPPPIPRVRPRESQRPAHE